ncbi:Uma2 family endonuclease [Microcoleus sp. PH2017_33_LGB_O_A]|uniref:Uma2 family endonuclease n=1 Tax=Microcoleus sp. PH2017_33_LGB_O_A TaxID=2798843 RepID=UPI0025E9C7DA|nr:Uma2 family endonuclease [Microcoleus sp. PH2017_33_LGB_O_A]
MVIAQTNPPNLASDATKTSFTPDEYRAMEETAEERHEYCNGEIIAMPGGSEVHSAIACNLLIHLGFLLRDTDFRLYNSDLRVWIPEYNCGTYTDLMVVNGEPEFHGSRVNICWSVKLNHILNNITISIARRAIAGNGKCTIGLKGRSSCTA